MTFDARDFLPSPSDWFRADVEYEGWGRAMFSDPEGSIEGPVSIRFDEMGGAGIEMKADPSTLQTERTLRFGLDEFLSGEEPTLAGGHYVLSTTLASRNPCVELEVETPTGVFRTRDVSISVPRLGAEVREVRFDARWSRFDVADAPDPKYWVLPLSNFVSDWRWRPPYELDRHPLRIFPTPEVPDEFARALYGPDYERDRRRMTSAFLAAESKNYLIIFEFGGALGFVERLPDYRDRKDSLLSGEDQARLTAVMVGDVGANPSADFDEVERWLRPFDLLALLALATGSEVGAPWVELRDGEGGLVRRIHRPLRRPRFRRGHRVIDEIPFKDDASLPTGTGRLITRALSRSEKFGEAFLNVAIVNLVRSKYRDQGLEESLVYLFRGLDGLCEKHGVAKQNLAQSLSADQKKAVKEALSEASGKIRKIKESAVGVGDQEAGDVFGRIESNVSNAANIKRNLGFALYDLLEHFGLPDAKIVDGHIGARPRTDGRKHLGGVVSDYRTGIIHRGYLDLSEAGEDWRDVWTVVNHLHDIMARVLLRILEYDGGYQPTVMPGRCVPYLLDWVKPDTPAGRLGYGRAV